jgi:hypothetical protein
MGEIEKRVQAEERLGEVEYQQLQQKYNQVRPDRLQTSTSTSTSTSKPMSYANAARVAAQSKSRSSWQRGGNRTRKVSKRMKKTRKH